MGRCKVLLHSTDKTITIVGFTYIQKQAMEREDGFSGYPNKIARTSTALTIHSRHDSAINVNNHHLNEQQQVSQRPLPACIIREQDQYMPIANVIRIMRRILPPHAKISDNAKETIQECVSEYISFVTGEANERCHREQRKTITAEDVIWAIGKLGFDDYVGPLSLFLSRYRERESARTSSNKELIFRRSFVDYGPLGMDGPFGSRFNVAPQQEVYAPFTARSLKNGSGSASGSSTQSDLPGFTPFAPFK